MIDNKNSHQIPEIRHSWTLECQPPPKNGIAIKLPIDEINEDFFKSRDIINDEEQKILTESIRENGLINIITVQVINDVFFLVAGNRRLRAAKDIGGMIASFLTGENRWVNVQRIEASGGMFL